MRVIGEPDLLRMIAGSRLQSAERFERWAFEDVLPQVVRTGSYAPALTEDEIVHQALAITTRRAQVLETRVAELEPVAAHAESFRQAEGLRTIADVANRFKAHCASHFPGVKVLHQEVFDHAGRLGIIIRGESVRHNQPTGQAIDAGWARTPAARRPPCRHDSPRAVRPGSGTASRPGSARTAPSPSRTNPTHESGAPAVTDAPPENERQADASATGYRRERRTGGRLRPDHRRHAHQHDRAHPRR